LSENGPVPPVAPRACIPAARWLAASAGGPAVVLLDQTRLPHDEVELCCPDVASLVDAIRRLAVRGAPLLGVVGGYGVALAAARAGGDRDRLHADADQLAAARPTAVNLGWGVRRVLACALTARAGAEAAAALAEADRLAAEDAAASAAMATAGLDLVPTGARILTHCNTGRLVSAGRGTAFAVIEAAHRHGRLAHLWVDETRPLLQGARLTAYEAQGAGIPYSVLADGAAGSLFAAGRVDLVLVGADRIAADGSVANKVGTYPLAVLAAHSGVPFVVVAPASTIDPATATGFDIVVEHRPGAEVTDCAGRPVTPPDADAYNPAFDVTPAELVTALVTERGVARPVHRAAVAALLRRPESSTGATMRR
jgi:methylthioribose-1-phosphate isomerase